jgi:tRNA-2-methylthio-N6-dimethylallyladenosine synthase
LGQNVNSWGLEKKSIVTRKNAMVNADQYEKPAGLPPFVELLREVSAIEGVKKIRFMTSNPWDFYDELIEEIGHNQKIDRFVHLPVQSGSNAVLARMNRGYTREDYWRIIKKLRAVDKKVTVGTDIIVGFCGETQEDFAQTVELVKEADFRVGFVAIYSPRPGTVAAKMYPDDVPFEEKKRRWEILDELINKRQLKQRPKIV